MKPSDAASRARSGNEFDVTTGWRRYVCSLQRAGVCAKTKRRIRRRSRRTIKRTIQKFLARRR